jgi:hypothetical protein
MRWIRRLKGLAGAAAVATTVATMAACGSDAGGPAGQGASQGALSPAEVDALTYTREEEKLARDVYRALGARHSMFANIEASEQRHMDAVLGLLDRYGAPDPVGARGTGRFANPQLQALHDELVRRGGASTVAALEVGVEIEELDIADIERAKRSTSRSDVLNVFDNLTRGSRNHLRSFYGALVSAGGTYAPKHLDRAAFDAVVSTPTETGPSARRP